MNRRVISCPALLLVFGLSVPDAGPVFAQATSDPSDSARVSATLFRFLTAFENLNWEVFRSSFSNEACVFFASARTPDRFCGRSAVEGRFQAEFATIRQGGPSGPPYMQLQPEGLRITMLNGTLSLVTFQLRNSSRVGRRSIVFRKEGEEWHILHLHASNVPWPDQP